MLIMILKGEIKMITNSQIIAMLNKQRSKEAEKRLRYRILLYNAIITLEEKQVFETHEELLDYLDMSEEEYKEIMENDFDE